MEFHKNPTTFDCIDVKINDKPIEFNLMCDYKSFDFVIATQGDGILYAKKFPNDLICYDNINGKLLTEKTHHTLEFKLFNKDGDQMLWCKLLNCRFAPLDKCEDIDKICVSYDWIKAQIYN